MILSMLENGKVVKINIEDIDFDLSCDVLCMGAGSAGIYAADAASREGASVILCEFGANIGGMHACGNVTSYYHGARGGSHEEEFEKCGRDTVFLTTGAHWEQKQLHVTERLNNSSVKVLCRHSATGIYFSGNRAVGLRVFNGEDEINIKASIIIDATSDGHLIRMTDVKKEYGRSIDGVTVPFTVRTQYVKNHTLYSNNEDSGYIDQYDKHDFSRKTIFSHANASRFLADTEFVNLALHTGIREGLIFEGEDCVRYSDIILRKLPEKILFWAYSDLDRHGNDRATDEELFQNWWVISNLATVTVNIPVPMGSIVPKGISGLVTAGRCLSCDTYSQTAVRMNRDMFRMGECVGTAAAMAALSGTDFLEIDYDSFLSRVRERGCFDGYADRAFGFENRYEQYLSKMHSLGRVPDEKYKGLAPRAAMYTPIEFDVERNFHMLKTDAPGPAIWSCYISENRKELCDRLYDEMVSAEETLYQYNCAITLGLLEDMRALPVLRKIVDERDCFYFTDNRRSNQFRSAVAICLIGRLGCKDDLPRLFEILSDHEIDREMYHTLKSNYLYHAVPDRNFVYFFMLTHTCASIVKIYQRCGLSMDELYDYFTKLFEGNKIIRRMTDTQKGEPAYDEMENFIQHILRMTKQIRS